MSSYCCYLFQSQNSAALRPNAAKRICSCDFQRKAAVFAASFGMKQLFCGFFVKMLAKREANTYNITEMNIASVGEATARIRIAAAKGWRHREPVNRPCRIVRHDLTQFHRLAELKLERDWRTVLSSLPRSGACRDDFSLFYHSGGRDFMDADPGSSRLSLQIHTEVFPPELSV